MKIRMFVSNLIFVFAVLLIISCATTPKIEGRLARRPYYYPKYFFLAVEKGDYAEVKRLLEEGVDVNAKHSESGTTALIEASSRGHREIVKMLIDAGANVNAVTDKLSRSDLIMIGWKAPSNCTALMFACGATMFGHDVPERYRDPDIVKMLITAGANVNTQNQIGMTALMYASKNGYTDIVKLLIDVGANVNAQDDEGYTALRLASKAGHTEIVQMLREAGAE